MMIESKDRDVILTNEQIEAILEATFDDEVEDFDVYVKYEEEFLWDR